MLGNNLLIFLLVVIILIVIGFLLYRNRVFIKIGIPRIISFIFSGSNEEKEPTETKIINIIGKQPINEITMGDKIIKVAEEPILVQPKTILKLINEDIQDSEYLVFTQQGFTQVLSFGIGLFNTVVGSIPAKEIGIQINCCWDGNMLSERPKIRPKYRHPLSEGWIAQREDISINYPAILVFRGKEDTRCVYGQPIIWPIFEAVLNCNQKGKFILEYSISHKNNCNLEEGKLEIRINNDVL